MANSPLQQTPRGLLGLFRLQTLGRAPSAFSDTVVPVASVAELYAADLLTIERVLTNTSSATPSGSLTVPNDELWRIRAASLSLTLDAAETETNVPVLCSLQFRPSGQTANVTLAAKQTTLPTGGWSASAEIVFPQPFIALPGSILNGFIVAGLTTPGTNVYTLSALIERIRA